MAMMPRVCQPTRYTRPFFFRLRMGQTDHGGKKKSGIRERYICQSTGVNSLPRPSTMQICYPHHVNMCSKDIPVPCHLPPPNTFPHTWCWLASSGQRSSGFGYRSPDEPAQMSAGFPEGVWERGQHFPGWAQCPLRKHEYPPLPRGRHNSLKTKFHWPLMEVQ